MPFRPWGGQNLFLVQKKQTIFCLEVSKSTPTTSMKTGNFDFPEEKKNSPSPWPHGHFLMFAIMPVFVDVGL